MAQEDQQQTSTQSGDGAGTPAARNGNGNGAAGAAPQTQQQPQDGASQGAPETNGNGKTSFVRSPIFRVILVVVVILGIIWGISYWRNAQNHVVTDDAYVTGDLINVSPVISGTLAKLNVDEGQQVKAGQIIAELDQSGPRAAYEQAKAAYQAALSQIPQAQTSAQFEQANVTASINQARAALSAQQAKTAQSQRQVQLTAQTTTSQVTQDVAQANAALAQAHTAQAQARAALQGIQTARSAAAAAHQQVNVAQANYTRAERDAQRYQALYGVNGSVAAVTAQQLDQAVATADSARAQLQAARDQASQADSNIAQIQAQANAALATANAAMKQYNAALAQVGIARANQIQVPVQQYGVANNAAVGQQSAAQLQAAVAGQSQVTLRKQQVLTARAQALQAKAAMESAQVTLNDTIIRAPTDGTVVRKGVNAGDALSPGQTIVTVTRGDNVWVSANYKETQLRDVRPGEPVDISVDAYPGKTFHGKVESINEASGNTTSLLPADNATGNFTKVVQRIPVKIVLAVPKNPGPHDATMDDIRNLRQGMSVVTDIDVTSARNNNH